MTQVSIKAPSVRPLGPHGHDARAPLVLTKLEPPPLPTTYAARDRISALLSLGATEWSQLTLVSAPPGYGKTMAVRGWLAQDDRPVAWLSLDPDDDDPVRLVSYLIGALRRVRPAVGERTGTLFGPRGLPAVGVVVATLLDEVAALDTPFVLVLDDYHLLTSEAGRELVERLVTHAPPFVQIVLITREDPRFPLARMRAHARLAEVRGEELRHTVAESAALLHALGADLSEASVELLADRTEGWAAGLQLAAVALRGRPGADDLVAGFGATHRYLIDYLGDEVMARLPDDLVSFLERTSVADRLCADLAAFLTDRTDTEQMLREVEERNLFLHALDSGHTWYRYHYLFADYLRNRLAADERQRLLLRAAAWCDAHDLAGEATQYALASDRWPEALPFVAAGTRAALERGELGSVLHWSAAVPASMLRSSSALLADRAWAGYLTGQMPVFASATNELADLDAAGRIEGTVAGRARGARAWFAVLEGRPEAGEALARSAVDLLADDPFFRGLTLLALSDACWDLGRTEENAAAIGEALRIASARPATLATYVTAYIYAIGSNEQGRRSEAERTCREMLAQATDATGRVTPAAGPLRVGLGMLCYEANDLASASAEIEAGFATCRRLSLERLLGGESRRARAMLRLAIAGPDAARQAVEEGLHLGREFLPDTRLPAAEAVAALVALRTGDERAALVWAERVLADPSRASTSPPNVRLYRDLVLARVLLATGAARRAEAVAVEAGRFARWAGTTLGAIQAGIVAACAAERRGNRAAARSRLVDAVALAAPGWYVRRFVEDAPPVAYLLPTVRAGNEAFVDAVLEALEAEAVSLAPGRAAAGSAWRTENGALLELLTGRELDVLRLLAQGHSNAGIAEALGMSPGTAKWHVANVLGKLGASSRLQAAARARDVGLV